MVDSKIFLFKNYIFILKNLLLAHQTGDFTNIAEGKDSVGLRQFNVTYQGRISQMVCR